MATVPLRTTTASATASTIALLMLLLAGGTAVVASDSAAAAERCSRAVGPVRAAPGTGRTVALTFDDGPTKFTLPVLRILRANNVRATFFMTGRHAAARPKVVEKVAAEGHLIAGHTYDHAYPSRVSGGWTRSYISDQFARTDRALQPATNKPICFFRPPGGYETSGMYDAARARGTAVVMWSVDTEDWKQPGGTTAAAPARIVDRATAGGSQTHPFVLFHDGKASHEPESQVSANRSNTVAALPRVIAYYRSHGYRFVDLAGGFGLPAEVTSMRVRATPRQVPAATRSVITGVLTATTGPVTDREVTWYARKPGARAWERRGTVRSDSTGRFRLAVRPRADTDYSFKLPASTRFRASSDTASVSTYTFATELSVAGPTAIVAGESVTLDITVRSNGEPRPGLSVLVSRSIDGEIVRARVATGAAGAATFVDQPPATARYTLSAPRRLPFDAASTTHDVAVTPPPPPEGSEVQANEPRPRSSR